MHSLKFISYKVINSSGVTMLASWKLDPYTVMRLNSGRRGDDVLKGGHLACSSHKLLQAPTLLSLRDSRPAKTKASV